MYQTICMITFNWLSQVELRNRLTTNYKGDASYDDNEMVEFNYETTPLTLLQLHIGNH